MSQNMDKRFRQVTLNALSIDKNKNQSSVTFLSKFLAYYMHKIMVYICVKHREGLSFDEKFTANDILPPFLNISHIVFSININARLGEGCETEEKKEKSGHLLSPNQIAS